MILQPFLAFFLQVFLLLVFTVTSGSAQELTVKPQVSRLYLANGAIQNLSCSIKDNTTGILDWKMPKMTPGKSPTKTENDKTVTVVFNPFNANEHEGEYECLLRRQQGSDPINSFTINVVGVEVSKNTPKFEFDKSLEPLSLSCDFNFTSSTSDQKSDPEWYQAEKKISSLIDVRFKESSNGLIITDPKRSDAGKYKAMYNITHNNKVETFTCEVTLEADPFVLPFDKSKNLIEEDKLELQCKVYGFPPSVVTWYKDGIKLNDSRAVMSDLEGHKDARLVIEKVEFSDAGDYNCTAYSQELKSSDSKVIVVRVKDKLAALWPFLGIVAEVLVLCLIIFIYEKRRNKQAQQAENDTQEIDQPDRRGNVRNRRNQN